MTLCRFSKMPLKGGERQGGSPPKWVSSGGWVRHAVSGDSHSAFLRFRASRRRAFFPHFVLFLPKAGPDSLQLARRMVGIRSPQALWEIVLHADEETLSGLPPDMFFDRGLVWHQQHLGIPGHVACAFLARRGRTLYGLTFGSDLVQRAARWPEHRTRVQKALSGWPDLLLSAVLHLAHRIGCTRLRSPSADLVLRHTDPARSVGEELFRRIYDRTLCGPLGARRVGEWWEVVVVEQRGKILPLETTRVVREEERTICLFHDVERGSGHRSEDPEFASRADALAPEALRGMLDVEREMRVKTTYNVVGLLLEEVRPAVAADGHSLAFHSFDHSRRGRQLERCREADPRIRGYRPPQSRMTRELSDRRLLWHNFDWLALAEDRLGTRVPLLENRVAKIPVLGDDYPLYRRELSFDQWATGILKKVEERRFAAIGLHDCYAEWWLPHYRPFLASLARLGRLRTLDEVADQVHLQATI